MSAAQRSARRTHLRVALVRDGRIVDERTLKPGEQLTVGPTERNAFVVASLPGSVTLVAWTAGGPTLALARGMTARLATDGGSRELGPAAGPVALDPSSRGRVCVGVGERERDTYLLFHFIEPPPPAERAALPIAARARLFDGFDIRTTAIAAFSFLFHFGAVGTAYADFADAAIEDDGARVTQTIGLLGTLPPAPPIEGPEPSTDKGPKEPLAPAARAREPAHAGRPSSPGPGGPPHQGGGERVSNARARAIASELEALDVAMLTGIGAKSQGNPTERVLEHGNVPAGLLDGIASDARGAGPGQPGGLALSSPGGVVRPGAGNALGLGELARTGRDTGNAVEKVAAPSVAPGRVTSGTTEVAAGKVADAGRVIGGLRGAFRACYRHELDQNPAAQGTIRVTATVGPNGEVRSTQVVNGGSLSSTMVSCVTRVVKGAQFSSPEGGTALVAAPLTFIPQ